MILEISERQSVLDSGAEFLQQFRDVDKPGATAAQSELQRRRRIFYAPARLISTGIFYEFQQSKISYSSNSKF